MLLKPTININASESATDKKVAIDLSPHPRQRRAFFSNATEQLYGGAAGGGKSHLMRAAAIIWAMAIPGLQVYLFRRTYPELLDNHINGSGAFPQMLADWIEAKLCNLNLSKLGIEFTFNGSKSIFAIARMKRTFKYQGAKSTS